MSAPLSRRLQLSRPTLFRPPQPFKNSFATSSVSKSSASSSDATASTLTWPEYLKLRKNQRRAGMVASVPTTIIGFLGGSQFGNIEADPTSLIMGIEPIYIYGLATLSCVGLGWLVGPTVGNFFWRQFHRKIIPAFDAKERLFFEHIKNRRADPSRNSVQNPIPDYYAEKVGSLRDYRHWLRDQAI